MEEIVNRVAKSPLITIDLETYYPTATRVQIDLADWMYEGLILREKEFRTALKAHDWTQYQDAHVAMHCSTDAIYPAWAFMLISTYLAPYAEKVVIGTLEDLDKEFYQDLIKTFDVSPYENKKVILKGCSNKPVPDSAYIQLSNKLQPVVNSLMFGEACSTVPLYKKSKVDS